MIRRQATLFFKACYDLSATFRWCLTGTPIQNRLEDVGTLFAFIRARPFHTLSTFRQYIVTPYDEGGDRRRVACERLVQLLDSLCLRRTKERLHLPGRQDRIVKIIFNEEERKQYEDTKMKMKSYIQQKAGEFQRHKTFSMFQAVLQLRILCNHGTFQKSYMAGHSASRRDMQEAAISALGHTKEFTCSDCKLPMPVLGSNRIHNNFSDQCSHVLCSECLENKLGISDTTANLQDCPLCDHIGISDRKAKLLKHTNNGVSSLDDRQYPKEQLNGMIEEEDDKYFRIGGHSSKIEALMGDVSNNLWSNKRYCHIKIGIEPPPPPPSLRKSGDESATKQYFSIIFSCWTRTLNLIDRHLQHNRIPFGRIDGGVALRERQSILDDFANDRNTPVLLMTTGTGAVG